MCKKLNSDFNILNVPMTFNVSKEKWIKGHKRNCRYGNNFKDKGLLVEERMERINVLENIVMFKSLGKT